jgi:phosphomethylpyrimidine synthase
VKQGCIAYKIAAHAADVALGIPGSARLGRRPHQGPRRAELGEALRARLRPRHARAYHDEDLDVDTDFCAMCGHDWCSVRISKEIRSSPAARPRASSAEEQRRVLEQRGNLPPAELHTQSAVGAEKGAKASCHSDYVDPDAAERIQLVSLRKKDLPVSP